MSFRNNLQHLRATRNMTQEQLAMLLGVSRQSVTKWEAEKSYPEMDKLLGICQIFGCTLDDLVKGDLTAVEPDVSTPRFPSGPATDICGYDEHMRRRAERVSAGVGLLVLGVAAAALLSAALGDASNVSAVGLFAFVAAGLVLIIPASSEHRAFKKAHPFVADFYTADEKAAEARKRGVGVASGVALVLVGLCVAALGSDTAYEDLLSGVFLVFVAAGVWLLVRASMLGARTNLAEYNDEALEEADDSDIESAEVDPARRDAMRAASRRKGIKRTLDTVIMLVATVVALVWLFWPMVSGDYAAYGTGVGAMFWLPWVIGAIGCAIASALVDAFVKA